jgi:phosphoglycerol transferase MdoB-like AlkP superfamily enzyme
MTVSRPVTERLPDGQPGPGHRGAPDVGRPSAPGHVGPRRRLVSVLAALLLTLVVAASCNAFLDVAQVIGEKSKLSPLSNQPPAVFLLSTGVVWLFLLGTVALLGRVVLSCAVFVGVTLLLGYVNHQKLSLRQEPFFLSDLAFAGQTSFLTEMVGLGSLAKLGALLLAVGVLALGAARVLRDRFPRIRRQDEPRTWLAWTASRLLGLVSLGLVLTHLSGFNADVDNRARSAYVAAGVHWAHHSQRSNYLRNGVVAGMLYNLNVPAMNPPAGYDEATMREVVDRWQARAEQLNEGRPATALADVNVVMVLSEAFTDPTRLQGVELEEDPIPFTRELMRRTVSGSMLTQTVGAGTANMEFEALSGLSLSQLLPQMTTPYQMMVPGLPDLPSAVGYFRHLGHDAVAVHPYGPRMYKRDEVYPLLGFSKFVTSKQMDNQGTIEDNPLISDAAAFREVQDEIEESESPLFVKLVTMQNHYPMADKYTDPMAVSGVDPDTAEQLGGYARGLKHSDDALREWVEALQSSSEKTAVIFYGDHAPSFWLTEPAADRNQQTLRQTPFFLWANYEQLAAEDAGPTSPIYFLPMLLDALGAELPPFYALLHDLRREVPAMEHGLYFTDGEFSTDLDDLGPRGAQLLQDYRLVQYDLSVGKGWATSEMFYPASAG